MSDTFTKYYASRVKVLAPDSETGPLKGKDLSVEGRILQTVYLLTLSDKRVTNPVDAFKIVASGLSKDLTLSSATERALDNYIEYQKQHGTGGTALTPMDQVA